MPHGEVPQGQATSAPLRAAYADGSVRHGFI